MIKLTYEVEVTTADWQAAVSDLNDLRLLFSQALRDHLAVHDQGADFTKSRLSFQHITDEFKGA